MSKTKRAGAAPALSEEEAIRIGQQAEHYAAKQGVTLSSPSTPTNVDPGAPTLDVDAIWAKWNAPKAKPQVAAR